MSRHKTVDDYVEGVLAGDRAAMGQTITLIESRAERRRQMAREALTRLSPHCGRAHRVGISGAPGVGKSTFIETFGCNLTAQGLKVAVLAVDPTSSRSGGSILGDKTRMTKLSGDVNAFIRPSPSSGHLGGVARATREAIIVCEAAGYDVVLVETVGAGQSETAVAHMVDFFLVLALPNAGDELQGLKKGILELADLIAVNKVDDETDPTAKRAKREYENALRILTPASANWTPRVMMVSGLLNRNLDALWDAIVEHRAALAACGELEAKRREQARHWMWAMIRDRLMDSFLHTPALAALIGETEAAVMDGALTPTAAAERLLAAFAMTAAEHGV